MRRRLSALGARLAVIVMVLIAPNVHSQGGTPVHLPGDSLLTIRYGRDSTHVWASIPLARYDTASGADAPVVAGLSMLGLEALFPGKGLDGGAPFPVAVTVGPFRTRPAADETVLLFRTDSAPTRMLPAVWRCAKRDSAGARYQVAAYLPADLLKAMAASGSIAINVGKEQFTPDGNDLAAMAAIAARVTADSLGSMTRSPESLLSYSASGVDVLVGMIFWGNPSPRYPTALEKSGTHGEVSFQFVVDTSGHVDRSTIQLVSATDPRFAEEVLKVLPKYTFDPAEACGVKVRQWVQMPFVFGTLRQP